MIYGERDRDDLRHGKGVGQFRCLAAFSYNWRQAFVIDARGVKLVV
jgi:hypothetical protein